MVYNPHEWQIHLLKIFKGKGVVKAFPGSGKTYGAILLIKYKKYKNVIVAVPTRKLKNQWIEELNKYKVFNVVVETFHILSKQKSSGLRCDFLIVDECHRSTSPVFQRLYKNVSYKHILGLTATPNKECLGFCGDVIVDVAQRELRRRCLVHEVRKPAQVKGHVLVGPRDGPAVVGQGRGPGPSRRPGPAAP